MSEAMTKAIIGMPFDLAMSDELSRMQFYRRSQSLLSDFAELEAECVKLREALRECLEAMEISKLKGRVYVSGRAEMRYAK